MKDKLSEAIKARENDVNSFVWKFARQSDGTQPEIRLMDATPEQLKTFYDHCESMLYSTDKVNPGRYTLLDIIREQREKCNIELFTRKMETGAISADGKGYPKFMYWQRILDFKKYNAEYFKEHDFESSPISLMEPKLPREFENLTFGQIMSAALDQLGIYSNKHLTFAFIRNLGICLTPEERKEFNGIDEEGNKKSKIELIKERLDLRPDTQLIIKQGGLSFNELRAMINLRTERYSKLTTEQLTCLRNKILFKLENEINYHIRQWENKEREILKICAERGISLN